MKHLDLLARLARPAESKIVLLVLDGVGDIANREQPRTALEAARTPHLDALAARSSLGRIVPVATGVTPGSGPGHLALFGYDPAADENDIGRGVLEALGLGIDLGPDDVTARGNFATADDAGLIIDRRAGRIATAECQRLCRKINSSFRELGDAGPFAGADAELVAGEAHRFVLVLRGSALSAELADTDPQQVGVAPLQAHATSAAGENTAALVRALVSRIESVIAGEAKANRVLLRGFSQLPHLRSMAELYRLRLGAFAGYPLYRGVASACGMEVVECGKRIGEIVDTVTVRWDDFDLFFLHVKQTDQAGEDGDLAAKIAAIEEVDRTLPRLLELGPTVIAVTGDHSTPAPMRAHSFHPVPLLVSAPTAFADSATTFDERAALHGHLGTFPARELIGLLLAHAGRLEKYGA